MFDHIRDAFRGVVRLPGPLPLAGRARLFAGLRPGPLADRRPARHRALSPGRLGRVRAPVPASAGVELRAHPADGGRSASRRSSSEAKPQNIEITMGFVGQVAPNYGMNNIVLFMRGPDDGQLRVKFREGSRNQAGRVPRAAPQGPARAAWSPGWSRGWSRGG